MLTLGGSIVFTPIATALTLVALRRTRPETLWWRSIDAAKNVVASRDDEIEPKKVWLFQNLFNI